MKIATWNVNSIRKRVPLVVDWLALHEPDVLCLQETKVKDEDFPLVPLLATGYHVTFRGRSGYNGVATLTRNPPEYVLHGLHEGPDNEDDRVLQTVVNGVPIVNTYVPQGFKVNSDKYVFKLEWFIRIRSYFQERFDKAKPLVWLGDLNVAPEPVDVYHPERRINDPDFHIDARNAFKAVVDWGFVDTFRLMHPARVQYSYWDYFRNAFKNNWGWRIDHILVTEPLVQQCRAVDVDLGPRKAPEPSDHTVVWAEFSESK